MDPALARTIALIIAYLVGGIPFGFLIARAKGVDIRKHGSGNIGATNVGRVLGRRFFVLCFILDMLKGLLPTLAFGLIFGLVRTESDIAPQDTWWWLGAMVAPVLGHMFSPYLGFKGGKGVATGLGALLAVVPVMTIAATVALAVFLISLRVWKYVGLSSSLAAASLPAVTAALVLGFDDRFGGFWPAIIVSAALAGVVIIKHRGNLQRIMAGKEPKAGSGKTPSEQVNAVPKDR